MFLKTSMYLKGVYMKYKYRSEDWDDTVMMALEKKLDNFLWQAIATHIDSIVHDKIRTKLFLKLQEKTDGALGEIFYDLKTQILLKEIK